MHTSAGYTFMPTPQINSSSSYYFSQHGSSSSLLPSSTSAVSATSSAPSISRLNIKVSIPASPSVNTAVTSSSRAQNVGETREYDLGHRLILTPDEDGFAPSYAGSHMVTESIKPFFNGAWERWKDFPYVTRDLIWNQFWTKCSWQPRYLDKIKFIFEIKAHISVTNMLYEAREKKKKPQWLRDEVWVEFLKLWNTPEFKKKSERAKTVRASVRGGSLHTGGSMSFAAHKRKMTKLKGEEVSIAEVFEETHKKKEEDGTRGEWVEPRAQETFAGFQRGLEEWHQTHPASEDGFATQPSFSDITSIWTDVAGGIKKGRVYRLGMQPFSYRPSPLSFGASTSQSEEMEVMRK